MRSGATVNSVMTRTKNPVATTVGSANRDLTIAAHCRWRTRSIAPTAATTTTPNAPAISERPDERGDDVAAQEDSAVELDHPLVVLAGDERERRLTSEQQPRSTDGRRRCASRGALASHERRRHETRRTEHACGKGQRDEAMHVNVDGRGDQRRSRQAETEGGDDRTRCDGDDEPTERARRRRMSTSVIASSISATASPSADEIEVVGQPAQRTEQIGATRAVQTTRYSRATTARHSGISHGRARETGASE